MIGVQPPVVALTATTKMIDGLERVRLNDAYVRAVRDAGLVPLVLAPVDVAALDAVLDAVAGVVITGGEDVDPREYGEAARPETHAPHSARDRCELTLVSRAHERRVPTLAICRGIQVVNVALGGTLVQDIAAECPAALDHDQSRRRTERVHDVSIERDSRLAQAIGGTRIAVNSSHHQSLARVADGLRVTAHASDRIVEGAEWTGDDWWMIGVQWHPEELVHAPEAWDRNLFAAFAAAVSAG